MHNEAINIENLTIDIFVDDEKDANAFLNQSVEEIKSLVLPEIEKQLLELNILSDDNTSLSDADLDLGAIELDLSAPKSEWKEILSKAVSEKIVEQVSSNSASNTESKNAQDPDKSRLDSQEDFGSKAERVGEVSSTLSGSLVELFVDFLKTGVLSSRKKELNISSYKNLEERITEVEATTLWTRLVPAFKRDRKTITRFGSQCSTVLWNNVVGAQFSNEVQQFVKGWIKADSNIEGKLKTVLLQFVVDDATASSKQHKFSIWKEGLIDFLMKNYSKKDVLEFIQVDLKTMEDSKESIPEEFQKQWKSFSEELLEMLNQSKVEVELVDSNRQIYSELEGVEIETVSTNNVDVSFDKIPVENAGIVLLQPFFPSMFKNLNFLNEKNEWIDEEAQVKAIYTLHYLATGEIEASEDQLLIEKLLTGYPLDEVIPLVDEEDLVTEELNEQMAELLDVIHDNWKPMRNCTWVGLRNDFLTRTAELELLDEMQYKLIVEPHLLDVLLPSKNWGVSMVKYSWMYGFVFVEWGS